jgi:hypothetical protein
MNVALVGRLFSTFASGGAQCASTLCRIRASCPVSVLSRRIWVRSQVSSSVAIGEKRKRQNGLNQWTLSGADGVLRAEPGECLRKCHDAADDQQKRSRMDPAQSRNAGPEPPLELSADPLRPRHPVGDRRPASVLTRKQPPRECPLAPDPGPHHGRSIPSTGMAAVAERDRLSEPGLHDDRQGRPVSC